MLRILIGHSYFLKLDLKQLERAKPYPPLATLQAAALLRSAGHEIALFDAMLADPGDFPPIIGESRPHLFILYEDNYNFLTKMCLAGMRAAACEMIRTARRANVRVIVAGPDATDDAEPYLKAGADVILLGEGLIALEQLVDRLDEHPGLAAEALADGVPSAVTLGRPRGRHIRQSGHTASLPSPTAAQPAQAAWDLIDVDHYRAVWRRAHGRFSLNMAASRGCPFRCAWCAKPIWGNRYLQRPAAEVAAELVHLKRTFAPDHIWFADDIFGFRVDWVREFSAAVCAADAIVPFTIQTRADIVTPRMAETLRAAGCEEAWLGAESGSQRILDAMRKGTEVFHIIAARERLKAQGIRVGFFIQLGYLGEQLPDLLATRKLIDLARPDEVGVSVSYPLPGTAFYEEVKSGLGVKTHWHDSGDLAMMFHGSYTSEFYRAVRELLHAEIDVQSLDAVGGEQDRGTARADLDRRWEWLIGREREFRNAAWPPVRTIHA
ncbi:MAG: B12-binding domain-containing radical SAM protein [Steroidobacteraceae bacterium]